MRSTGTRRLFAMPSADRHAHPGLLMLAWLIGILPALAAADHVSDHVADHAAAAARGRQVALDPGRGDCAICHRLPAGDPRNQGTLGPPLLNLAGRYDAPALKARIVDPKRFNPQTAMPGYGVGDGLHRVPAALAGRPILTEGEIDDLVVWLLVDRP